MNNELFDRVMSAVDDDLLEEAQYPARAKRPSLAPWIALVVGAAACLAVIVTARAQTRAPGYPESSLAVNPLQTVNVLAVEELGYRLPLPEDAQKPSYFLIDPGKPQAAPVAEVRFERNGATYTCRTQKTAAATDISGLYIEWSQSYTWSSDTLEVTVAEAEDLTTCVSWYEETTGTQWCLSGDRNGPELAHTAGSIMNTLGFDLGVGPCRSNGYIVWSTHTGRSDRRRDNVRSQRNVLRLPCGSYQRGG